MSDVETPAAKGGLLGGAVKWMATNSVAANLLLFLVFFGGLFGALVLCAP